MAPAYHEMRIFCTKCRTAFGCFLTNLENFPEFRQTSAANRCFQIYLFPYNAEGFVSVPAQARYLLVINDITTMCANEHAGVQFFLQPRYRPGTEEFLFAVMKLGVMSIGLSHIYG